MYAVKANEAVQDAIVIIGTLFLEIVLVVVLFDSGSTEEQSLPLEST